MAFREQGALLLTQPDDPRYQLNHDTLMGTYTVTRIQVMGTFATREEARQYMIDTAEERKVRDAA